MFCISHLLDLHASGRLFFITGQHYICLTNLQPRKWVCHAVGGSYDS